jgi:hypothetical protein
MAGDHGVAWYVEDTNKPIEPTKRVTHEYYEDVGSFRISADFQSSSAKVWAEALCEYLNKKDKEK